VVVGEGEEVGDESVAGCETFLILLLILKSLLYYPAKIYL
jgi:hypothetical protein